MNFLRSEDLIVLVPFPRDQNQIAPLSRPQRDADGCAPIFFNPVTPFGLRPIIPKLLQTSLLYSILDFGQNPERVFVRGLSEVKTKRSLNCAAISPINGLFRDRGPTAAENRQQSALSQWTNRAEYFLQRVRRVSIIHQNGDAQVVFDFL